MHVSGVVRDVTSLHVKGFYVERHDLCLPGASAAEKHAVVLGLKAFVLAHPYDVPKWLPDLLLLLVRASLQPAPIKTSVRYPVLLSTKTPHPLGCAAQ